MNPLRRRSSHDRKPQRPERMPHEFGYEHADRLLDALAEIFNRVFEFGKRSLRFDLVKGTCDSNFFLPTLEMQRPRIGYGANRGSRCAKFLHGKGEMQGEPEHRLRQPGTTADPEQLFLRCDAILRELPSVTGEVAYLRAFGFTARDPSGAHVAAGLGRVDAMRPGERPNNFTSGPPHPGDIAPVVGGGFDLTAPVWRSLFARLELAFVYWPTWPFKELLEVSAAAGIAVWL